VKVIRLSWSNFYGFLAALILIVLRFTFRQLVYFNEVLELLAVAAAILAEDFVDCLGVLVTNVCDLGGSLQFDLFDVDHVQKFVSLLVADTGVSSLLLIGFLRYLIYHLRFTFMFDFKSKGIGSGIVYFNLPLLLILVLEFLIRCNVPKRIPQ